MPADLRLRIADLDWREVEGRIVVITEDGRELVINPAGSVLWHLLAAGTDRNGLQARLIELFGIDALRAQQDVEAFLASLRERGLLEGLTGERREA